MSPASGITSCAEWIEIECSDVDAKLWEIAENLHRADLTQLQRKQIALWIKLTDEKSEEEDLLRGVRAKFPADPVCPKAASTPRLASLVSSRGH